MLRPADEQLWQEAPRCLTAGLVPRCSEKRCETQISTPMLDSSFEKEGLRNFGAGQYHETMAS